jgi:hypothetical protein
VPVGSPSSFRPGRSFRRVLARNDLTGRMIAAVSTDEHISCFIAISAVATAMRDDRMDRGAYTEMPEVAPETTRLVNSATRPAA